MRPFARTVPGMVIRDAPAPSCAPGARSGPLPLDTVPRPSRHWSIAWRKDTPARSSAGLADRDGARLPVPLLVLFDLAAARSQRARNGRSNRSAEDFAAVGDDVFVADDLFWYHPSRSLALAAELKRRGIRKQWMLVQSRVNLVARHADLLEAWRPIAKDFDIFFGLEAATDDGLEGLGQGRHRRPDGAGHRGRARARIRRDRQLRDRSGLAGDRFRTAVGVRRASSRSIRQGSRSSRRSRARRTSRRCARASVRGSGRTSTCIICCGNRRSGPGRFFDLYCETWRRSVLNLRGRKSVWQWMREVDPRQRVRAAQGAAIARRRCSIRALHGRVQSGAAGAVGRKGLANRIGRALRPLPRWGMGFSASRSVTRRHLKYRRIDRRVDDDLIELHHLGIAVRERHAHGVEQHRIAFEPQFEARDAFLICLRFGVIVTSHAPATGRRRASPRCRSGCAAAPAICPRSTAECAAARLRSASSDRSIATATPCASHRRRSTPFDAPARCSAARPWIGRSTPACRWPRAASRAAPSVDVSVKTRRQRLQARLERPALRVDLVEQIRRSGEPRRSATAQIPPQTAAREPLECHLFGW